MISRKLQRNTLGSYYILLPKMLIEALGYKKGLNFEIEYKKNTIILTPVPEALAGSTVTGVETTHPEACAT